MKIHHIGYLVKNINRSMQKFLAIDDYEIVRESIWDDQRKSHIAFLRKEGYCIELVAPTKESDIYPLLKRYKNSPYHICYEVDDITIEVKIAELENNGYTLIRDVAPAVAIGGKVAFLMGTDMGMIELLQCD